MTADLVVADVEACPRCGRRHEQVEFRRLTGPQIVLGVFEELTHWALCPQGGQPILMGQRDLSSVGPRMVQR